MIKDRVSFYRRLANLPALSNNLFSVIMANVPDFDSSNRESFFAKVAPLYSRYKLSDRPDLTDNIDKEVNGIEDWEGRDLRIENIKLQGVRGLPASETPFGIDFTDDNQEPQSMVILGANGSGKSTIYDAIEYSFCQTVGEANLRTAKSNAEGSDYYKTYLANFNVPFSKAECNIQLKFDTIFKLDRENIPLKVRQRINPNSCFISDYDIYENGKLDYQNYSFQNLIAKSLGLNEFLQIEKELRGFDKYDRRIETIRAGSLRKEIKNAETSINENQKLIEAKKRILESLQEEGLSTKDNDAGLLLAQNIIKLKSVEYRFDFSLESFLDEAKNFADTYNEFAAISESSKIINQIDFLKQAIKLLKEDDSCPVCRNSKSTNSEIEANLNDRISKLESFNSISQKLSNSSTKFLTLLNELKAQFVFFKQQVEKEILVALEMDDVFELRAFLNASSITISELLSSDFFINIQELDNPSLYGQERNHKLRSIVDSYEDFYRTEIPKFINTIKLFEPQNNSFISALESTAKAKSITGSKEGEMAILQNDIAKLEKQISIEETNIQVRRPELEKVNKEIELFGRVKREVREYISHFHAEISRETRDAFESVSETVKSVLDKYLYDDSRNVILEIKLVPEKDEETGEVVSESIAAYIKPLDSNLEPISINKYFNTFHYRLFCTMVALSVAIATRKNTKVNMPIILDDIFYSSDFVNRVTIEKFIERIFELFQLFTPKMKLQLILFTHDQLIFESIIRASRIKKLDNIVFAKIFKHEESEHQDEYKNLIYRLPKYSPNIQFTESK